jgi:hypothetical protein
VSAAKKIILLLWLVVASFVSASALTPGAAETRVGQKSFAPVESRLAQPLQTAGRHQENAGCGYELAPESLLAAEATVQQGTQLYRVFGNEAQGLGNYYTTVNPGTIADFRTTAGLFPGNSGSFVLEGTLNNTEGVILRTAAPGPGGVGGGLPEVFVPNPATQININRVSGINPHF